MAGSRKQSNYTMISKQLNRLHATSFFRQKKMKNYAKAYMTPGVSFDYSRKK